jgi:hypothetical protein
MKFATKSHRKQVLIWLIWAITIFVFTSIQEQTPDKPVVGPAPVMGIVITHDWRNGPLFPWKFKYRLRVLIRHRRRIVQRAYRRIVRGVRLAELVLRGALTMAQIVDLLTCSQLRRYLGALPVLYTLLETLRVREIINQHCPTFA